MSQEVKDNPLYNPKTDRCGYCSVCRGPDDYFYAGAKKTIEGSGYVCYTEWYKEETRKYAAKYGKGTEDDPIRVSYERDWTHAPDLLQ